MGFRKPSGRTLTTSIRDQQPLIIQETRSPLWPVSGINRTVAADTYTAAQVQWSGVPTGEVVEVFLQREYDRLYYLSFDMPQCQYYIYRLLKVRLSIGPLLSDCDHSFDLNIELKNEDISTLIKEVKKGIAHLTGM